jgi:hypothetical protein
MESDELATLERNALAWVLFCERMRPWLVAARDDPTINKHRVVAKVLAEVVRPTHSVRRDVSPGTGKSRTDHHAR